MPEYVYGIVRPGSATGSREGIAGAPLRLIEGAGAAALASHIADGELQLRREELMTHARVLGEALSAGPVLPMRAGIVMSDDAEVRERLLDAHRTQLVEDLARFDGTFQADVRVVYEEEALMRQVVAGDPEILRLRDHLKGLPDDATLPDRIRLGEMVAGAVEEIRARDQRELLAVLGEVSLAVEVSPTPHERVALAAAFLIERARSAEFDDVLEALAAAGADRLRFRYTGPLPPHSFVELTEAA